MFRDVATVVAVTVVEFSTSVFTPFSGIVEILELELGTKDVSTAVTLDRLPLMLFVLLVLLLQLLLLLLVTLTLGTDVAKVLLLLLMMVDEADNAGATDDGMVVGDGAMLDDTNDILGEDDTDEDEVIDGGAGTADEGVALRDKLAFVGAVLADDTVAVVEVVVIVGTVVLFSVIGAPGPGCDVAFASEPAACFSLLVSSLTMASALSLLGTTDVALLSLVLVPLLLEMVLELLVLFPILVADVDVVDPVVVDVGARDETVAAEGEDAVDVVTVLDTDAINTDAVVAVVLPVALGS